MSPKAQFETAGQALASLDAAWAELETRIDASLLESKRGAQAALSAAGEAASERARNDAFDDLAMRREDLARAILRLELLHRNESLGAALLREGFGKADRQSVDERNAELAERARSRLVGGYRDARKAIYALR